MRKFESGATRDTVAGKLSYVKGLSPAVLKRYLQYLNLHRKQPDGSMREFDNWKKGIEKDVYLDSLGRHFVDVWLLHNGYPAEDNHGPVDIESVLCAIMFNSMGMLHEILKGGTSPGYADKKQGHSAGIVILDEFARNLGPFSDFTDFPLDIGPLTKAGTLMQYCTCGGVKPVEDDKPEEFMEFIIKRSCSAEVKWFIELKFAKRGVERFLHADLKLHKHINNGYYKTKAKARATIVAYKNKPVLHVRYASLGWYIVVDGNSDLYLCDDLMIHDGTGATARRNGRQEAYGYYLTKGIAEAYVKAYEEKQRCGQG